MNFRPPSWADRFLRWYCNPELLEEIQGDAHELYFERVKIEGKRSADRKYFWDVIRFCRWSNIKRESGYLPGSLGGRWNLNFKMSVRNAQKNKLIFGVKTMGLSICLAFALLLAGFIVNEITFDQFHQNHDRIYRITSTVNFKDQETNYAVSPLPIGQALTDDVPEVENYCRFMHEVNPIFKINDEFFYDEEVLSADSNFLDVFTFEFVSGSSTALNGPDKIVLTETLARKLFGDEDAVGKTIEFRQAFLLEVSAVIKDVPANSHLQFSALISWETVDREEGWGNLNAYSYILLKPDATIETVNEKLPSVMEAYDELILRDFEGTFSLNFEKITDIHFSKNLEEDIAEKRNGTSMFILTAVVILFLITGLINYLNLTLAELTTNAKRIGILKVFGGLAEGHSKLLYSEIIVTLSVVLPVTALLSWSGWRVGADYLSIHIDPQAFFNPLVLMLTAGFITLLLVSAYLNSLVLSRTSHIFNSISTKFKTGFPVRKFLVAAQLSFSIIMIALIVIIVDQFHFIRETDKGFEDHNTIIVKFRSQEYQAVESFREEVRKISGVSNVGNSSYYPGIIETKYVFEVETESGMEQRLIPLMFCSYEYLDLLNVRMAKGRGFSLEHPQDGERAFIINETAEKQFGWKNGVGKKIDGPVLGSADRVYREGEVIGVVRDFNFASMHNKIEPMIIFPTDENWGTNFIYIKTDPIHPPDLVATVEKEFKSRWAELPFEWEYLDAKYMGLYEKDLEMKNIFEVGLIISILTSAMGIFSISALLVTIRTKEMGIRKVSGATPVQLFILHSKSFLQFLILAVIVSSPVIWYLSGKWLQNFVYHIDLSIQHFIIPAVIACAIVIATSFYHGVRSAMTNPVDVLKHE